jgi:orotate phosphoribosyltransferase
MDPRQTLLDELAIHAYQYRPEQPFVLVSGAKSDEYLDCKLALSQPKAMSVLGQVILRELPPDVVAIGGLTMGSDPIAMSTAQASAGTQQEVRWFSVRKDQKEHGQKKRIEGAIKMGERVAVVDDVVTSGMSTIAAIKACREFGLDVAIAIVLVDRQQSSGIENIQRELGEGTPVKAIFTRSEIKERWFARRTQKTLRVT